MKNRMKQRKPDIILSDGVKHIIAAITQDRGLAEGEKYKRTLVDDHHRQAKRAWRATPADQHNAMFVVVHERTIGENSVPLIVTVEFVADEQAAQGEQRQLYLLHFVEAVEIPQIAMLISVQKQTGKPFGVHYGFNKERVN